ncbi:MAG: radical SAM protein, partial [Candidatus Marinimicrobia bacterium]|nr:radical SAM protein [Candidatus Neomarinimicrobiota bacterium]
MSPSYIELFESGELQRRANTSKKLLHNCDICPWDCGVNRLNDETGVCRVGRLARVSSFFPHRGEEDVLRGWNGSGTIFFSGCNLRCVFCQNHSISQKDRGEPVTSEELAGMMLSLQSDGCHNINLVTPEHVVPQILEALFIAAERGLQLPLVYNSSGFDSLETLELLDGIVDIYMPDFKYWDADKAKKYLKTSDYPDIAKTALKEMHSQVGDLQVNEQGLAVKGLMIRHLLMPDGAEDSRKLLAFVSSQLSQDTYINIMDQYYPAAAVSGGKYPEINRRMYRREISEA